MIESPNQVIAIRRRRTGELVLRFSMEPIRQKMGRATRKVSFHFLTKLVHFFQLQDTSVKLWYGMVLIAGLGVGIGLVVGTTMAPTVIQATPTQEVLETKLSVIWVSIPAWQRTVSVKAVDEPTLSWLTSGSQAEQPPTSAILGETGAIVIGAASSDHLFEALGTLSLGQQILVTGSNKGQYSYRVTELKEIPPNQLANLSSATEPQLILYTRPGGWYGDLMVAIAKPSL